MGTRLLSSDPGIQVPYYIRRKSKVSAPMDASRLKELHRTGQLKDTDEISESPNGPWTSAKVAFRNAERPESKATENLSSKVGTFKYPSPRTGDVESSGGLDMDTLGLGDASNLDFDSLGLTNITQFVQPATPE